MRLLVSVRSAEEAAAAVAGGADIVDAKEPARGSLGPVALEELERIAAGLPGRMPFSVALGDYRSPRAAAERVVEIATRLPRRTGPLYFKLGFSGAAPAEVDGVVEAAVAAGRRVGAGIVAAAYADYANAAALAPSLILRAAARRGADGVLLDTWSKDGSDLLHWVPARPLGSWIARARRQGLLTAIAGSLGFESLRSLAGFGADIAGVRGAVCEGGRAGVLRACLVAEARAALAGGRIPAGLDEAASAKAGVWLLKAL